MSVISTAGVGIDQAGNIERYQPPYVLPAASGADVGPTAPAAPRPGTIWFDGSALQIWDGTAWHAVGTTGGGVPEPGAVGNFLRTNTGTWVAGLPLTGGTMTAMNAGGVGLTLNVNANAVNGITLTTSAFNSVGLLVNAGGSGGAARGIQIETTLGTGLAVFNRGLTSTGVAVRNEAGTGISAAALSATNAAGTGIALLIDNPSADGGSAIEVRRSNAGASSPSIRMRMSTAPLAPLGQEFGALSFAGSIAPGGFADGAVIAASAASAWAANTPGGTRLDFKITPPGSTTPDFALTIDQNRRLMLWDGAQMQTVTFGAADSGGTGFRQLIVPN